METTTLTPDVAAPSFELKGDGYALIIPKAALAAKQETVSAAAAIVQVTTSDESYLAQREVRNLAQLRIAVEKSRNEVKKPVLDLGREIDARAKDFLAEVTTQESRLKKLVSTHAEEVEAARRAAEAEERRKAAEAKAAAEAAERAKQAEEAAKQRAASAANIADTIEAKRKEREAREAAEAAERERLRTLSERREASAAVVTTRVNDGVRFTDDFDVEDIAALYAARPDLVSLSAKTNDIKRLIKEMRDAGQPLALPGLRIFRKPVVSTR